MELGKASCSHYLFSNVWGLADIYMHFAKHFPLNFTTGISWMEFNCFIGDSFALYRSECCFGKVFDDRNIRNFTNSFLVPAFS